jgi:hypothetical protein
VPPIPRYEVGRRKSKLKNTPASIALFEELKRSGVLPNVAIIR